MYRQTFKMISKINKCSLLWSKYEAFVGLRDGYSLPQLPYSEKEYKVDAILLERQTNPSHFPLVPDRSLTYGRKHSGSAVREPAQFARAKSCWKNAYGLFICCSMKTQRGPSEAPRLCHRDHQVAVGTTEPRCVLDWVSAVRTGSQGQKRQILLRGSLWTEQPLLEVCVIRHVISKLTPLKQGIATNQH